MPTYEYRCPSCSTDFEKFQRMSDEPVAECPKCGARAERRLSAGAGLLFKGSGFYITDYRSDSYKSASASEKGGGSDKSESKGAAEKGPSPASGAGSASGTKSSSTTKSSSASSE